MLGFFLVVIGVGWFVSYAYNSPGILYVAVVLSLVMNITSYWYSDKIALGMYRAQPVTRESHPELWNSAENLAITAGLPMPRLFIINDPQPNAFATGRNKEHAAIAVTTGLLATLNRTELDGVIAHELSHIGNRDILLSSVVVVLVGLLTILSDMFIHAQLFGGRGGGDSDRGNQAGAVLMIVGVVFMVLSPIIATIIQLAISRKREFLADASGALLTRYPEGLASALEKISGHAGAAGTRSTVPMRRANNATAHLFISNPFGARAMNGVSKLFMTHPPVEERVKALRGMN